MKLDSVSGFFFLQFTSSMKFYRVKFCFFFNSVLINACAFTLYISTYFACHFHIYFSFWHYKQLFVTTLRNWYKNETNFWSAYVWFGLVVSAQLTYWIWLFWFPWIFFFHFLTKIYQGFLSIHLSDHTGFIFIFIFFHLQKWHYLILNFPFFSLVSHSILWQVYDFSLLFT